jgi:hypothetical protein
MNHDTYTAAMRASLAECVAALQRMDARLLKLTASPKDCELGEIKRARKLLDTDPAQLAPAHEIRTAAAVMLAGCQAGLSFIENRFIADHGQRDIGEAWGALIDAVVAGRSALHPGRRFIARPHDCGQTWEVIDTRHPLAKTHGPRVVMSGFHSADTIKAEDDSNAAAG